MQTENFSRRILSKHAGTFRKVRGNKMKQKKQQYGNNYRSCMHSNKFDELLYASHFKCFDAKTVGNRKIYR